MATVLHRATEVPSCGDVAAETSAPPSTALLIGGCEMLVAERMHAAIAGLSTWCHGPGGLLPSKAQALRAAMAIRLDAEPRCGW